MVQDVKKWLFYSNRPGRSFDLSSALAVQTTHVSSAWYKTSYQNWCVCETMTLWAPDLTTSQPDVQVEHASTHFLPLTLVFWVTFWAPQDSVLTTRSTIQALGTACDWCSCLCTLPCLHSLAACVLFHYSPSSAILMNVGTLAKHATYKTMANLLKNRGEARIQFEHEFYIWTAHLEMVHLHQPTRLGPGGLQAVGWTDVRCWRSWTSVASPICEMPHCPKAW